MSSSLVLKETAVPHVEFSLTGAATYILFKRNGDKLCQDFYEKLEKL